MTVNELSQLYYLNREIEGDQKRLMELRAISTAPSAAKLTGMPRSPGVGDPTGKYAVEIASLEAIIEKKTERCFQERERLERYIADISDSETRWIFTLRFVNGLPWAQVAASLGEGNTADRVKKVCYRYLQQINEAENTPAK